MKTWKNFTSLDFFYDSFLAKRLANITIMIFQFLFDQLVFNHHSMFKTYCIEIQFFDLFCCVIVVFTLAAAVLDLAAHADLFFLVVVVSGNLK